MLPWTIKPLYGFLSDGLPLFGYRRKSYLVGAGAVGTSAWLALATVVSNAPQALSSPQQRRTPAFPWPTCDFTCS